jgi:hypothetical protein
MAATSVATRRASVALDFLMGIGNSRWIVECDNALGGHMPSFWQT